MKILSFRKFKKNVTLNLFQNLTILQFLLLFAIPLPATEILTKVNASWTTVIPGTVICEPVETSYGFCLVTDARNVIGYSNEGKQLWEKPIGKSRNVELSVLKNDFLLIFEKNENKMKILNPSGTEIWAKNIDFVPRDKVLNGYDGRFFVYSEDKICCYGINGLCKWEMQTPTQKNIPLQQLPDGSIVVFYNETQGKTVGMRISPFGKQMEEITFAGNVQKSFSCKDGILLVFTDGTSGLFSIKNKEETAQNKWVLQKKNINSSFLVSPDLQYYVHLENNPDNVIINIINCENGFINLSKKIDIIKGNKLQKSYCNDSGIFLCDDKNAVFYDYELKELFFAQMPSKQQQNYNYLLQLSDNYLIFCNKDWSLASFRLSQKIGSKIPYPIFENSYTHFYNENENIFSVMYMQDFGEELTNSKRIQNLKNGYYADLEREYLNEILSICKLYHTEINSTETGMRKEQSIFDLDIEGFQNILLQLTLFCNDSTQNLSAKILKNCNNRNYSYFLLTSLNGYDPDGEILTTLEKLSSTVSFKDTTYINAICDCVYKICYFMGRPAYNTKGKKILKKFMNPSYNTINKNYARSTMGKIFDLDL